MAHRGRIGAPAAYEIFRMGYYGPVVPNTALAKEGSRLRPVRRQISSTRCAVPARRPARALPCCSCFEAGWALPGRAFTPQAALAIGGALHLGCVVAIGGDFMSGRLLP
jgi:arabinofuranosyltransferase